MAEEQNKKPDEAKKPEQEKNVKRETIKVERDKKGRFVKQNKDDNAGKADDSDTVKIKIVAGKIEEPKKSDEKENKNPDGKKKDEKNTTGATVTIVGVPVRWWNWKWADRLQNKLWKEHDRMMDEMDRLFDSVFDNCSKLVDTSLDSFVQRVSDTKPDTITINGRKYYSEENVAHKVAETIDTCAKVATEEMAKNAAACGPNAEKPSPIAPEAKPAPVAVQKSAPVEQCPCKEKEAKVRKTAEKLSKVCANLIMVGVVAFAAIGLAEAVKFLFF